MATIDGPVVLVVDDEAQIRRFLHISLEANGYRVHEAVTGHNHFNMDGYPLSGWLRLAYCFLLAFCTALSGHLSVCEPGLARVRPNCRCKSQGGEELLPALTSRFIRR